MDCFAGSQWRGRGCRNDGNHCIVIARYEAIQK